MAQKVFNIIIKLMKEGGADKETVSGLVDIKNALVAGAAIAGAVAVAYKTVDKVLDETVGKFATYAKGVDVFSSALSTSSEEGSRLIQVADDFGISAEEMQTSMFRAVKEGMEPTIAGLAGMADEYNALATPQEKADFLVKNFGKSSQELTRLLGEGSQALRDRSAAVEDSLVLDEAAIKKARDYEAAQDKLIDSSYAMKIAIGEWAIPLFIKLIETENKFIGVTDQQNRAIVYLDAAYKAGKITVEEYNAAIDKLNLSTNFHIGLIGSAARDLTTWAQHMYEASDAGKKAAAAIEEIAAAAERLRKELVDQTGWEAMYTGAEDAAGRSEKSFDLMGSLLQGLSADGALVWEGFLTATGRISPEAITQFVLIQKEFERIKALLSYGIPVNVVIAMVYKEIGAITDTTANAAVGGAWQLKGTSGYGANSPVYLNAATGQYSRDPNKFVPVGPGGAGGLDFVVPPGYPNDTFPFRAQSGERVSVTPQGVIGLQPDRSMASLLSEIRSMKNSIEGLPRQLAAEIQKRR
jgi:hypothetical protein